ncbi:MAG: hypothetical protein ACR2PA_08345 [Hyphomicrobiaceae bacterium]
MDEFADEVPRLLSGLYGDLPPARDRIEGEAALQALRPCSDLADGKKLDMS